MKILAISGSLSKTSGNRTLLGVAGKKTPPDVTFHVWDGLRDLPHFDPELEADGPLPEVEELRQALRSADAVLLACPEYGHSLPGSLKNAIDWVIGSGELEQKVVGITAAVPHPDRGRRGLGALRDTLGAVSAVVVGGEPIAKGPSFEAEVGRLVVSLIEAARAPREE
ncbi:MAG TPA: NADPH-dependent FMN reductase [Polyangiaceae bacterium]|nr:NADPH-dependent FMN reductase [Polyangiaceae bacterium]